MDFKKIIIYSLFMLVNACSMKEELIISLSSSDENFMTDASYGNLGLIHHGNAASAKTMNNDVQVFAGRITQQSLQAQKDLIDRAGTLRFSLPAEIDSAHILLADQLTLLRARAYDSVYLLSQIQILNGLKELYKHRLDSNSHGLLGRFAAMQLPEIQENLVLAEQIRSSMKIDL